MLAAANKCIKTTGLEMLAAVAGRIRHGSDALMQLALDFENNHYCQIRRHYEAISPDPDEDPRQLDLFREQSAFARRDRD